MLLAGVLTFAFFKWDAREAKEERSARALVKPRDLTTRVPANVDRKMVKAESRSPSDFKATPTTTKALHEPLPLNNTIVMRESAEPIDPASTNQKSVDTPNGSANEGARPSASQNQQGDQLSSSGPHKNAAGAEERNTSSSDGSRSLERTPTTERSVSGPKSDNKKVIRWP